MKKLLLDRLAAYLLGGKVWKDIQHVVAIVESPDLSGSEKRARALEVIGKLGIDLAAFLINLGIEMAVAKVRM